MFFTVWPIHFSFYTCACIWSILSRCSIIWSNGRSPSLHPSWARAGHCSASHWNSLKRHTSHYTITFPVEKFHPEWNSWEQHPGQPCGAPHSSQSGPEFGRVEYKVCIAWSCLRCSYGVCLLKAMWDLIFLFMQGLFIISSLSADPLPGACNMEFVLENDPNIHLTSMTQAFKVQYAEANIGISKRESVSQEIYFNQLKKWPCWPWIDPKLWNRNITKAFIVRVVWNVDVRGRSQQSTFQPQPAEDAEAFGHPQKWH